VKNLLIAEIAENAEFPFPFRLGALIMLSCEEVRDVSTSITYHGGISPAGHGPEHHPFGV
jgi:hypothetical protein